MPVLTPLTSSQMKAIFNETAIQVINYMIKKSIFSQPERMVGQPELPIQIPKEHIEQWLAQALNAKSIGAGSYPVDLIAENNDWGADIKMLSASVDEDGELTNADTGETSLGQNFKGAGKMLDQFFANQEHEKIKDLWLKIIEEKLSIPTKDHGIKHIYYFILIRGGTRLYLAGMQVNAELLHEATVDYKRTTPQSVYIENYIDGSLGNVKIYKAKKRMELRLHPKNWLDNGYLIPFEMNLDSDEINIKPYIEDGNDIMDYGKDKAQKIFN